MSPLEEDSLLSFCFFDVDLQFFGGLGSWWKLPRLERGSESVNDIYFLSIISNMEALKWYKAPGNNPSLDLAAFRFRPNLESYSTLIMESLWILQIVACTLPSSKSILWTSQTASLLTPEDSSSSSWSLSWLPCFVFWWLSSHRWSHIPRPVAHESEVARDKYRGRPSIADHFDSANAEYSLRHYVAMVLDFEYWAGFRLTPMKSPQLLSLTYFGRVGMVSGDCMICERVMVCDTLDIWDLAWKLLKNSSRSIIYKQ